MSISPAVYTKPTAPGVTSAPVRSEKLALLMAAGAEASELAGEGDQELMATLRAAHPGDAVAENAAVEVAVDHWLNAAPKVAVGALKSLLVDQKEALEAVGESPIEDRALGMARAIDSGTRCKGIGGGD